jgi:hypothetical protein
MTERSFTALQRIKTYLQSRMLEDRLNALAMLNTEAEIAITIDYKDVTDPFPTQQGQ